MKSEYKHNCLVMVDEEKNTVKLMRGEQNCMYIVKASNKNNIIALYSNPLALIQIADNEFLVNYGLLNDNKNKLEHLVYNGTIWRFDSKFELVYDNNNDNFFVNKNVVIVNDGDLTTIYNYKNGKKFSFNNLEILGTKEFDGNMYLTANIKVGNTEKLLMYIDVESLEFSEFYSLLQDRYIKVEENEKINFQHRLVITLEKEIYGCVEYLEEYEDLMLSMKFQNAYKKLERKK